MIPEIGSLPSSDTAERSVLGAAMIKAEALDEARSSLRESDFYLESHRRIYRTMCKLSDLQKTVDIVTVSQVLTDSGEAQSVGGVAYIISLTDGLPVRISIAEYIDIVKEKSALRKLINTCSLAISNAIESTESVSIVSSIQDGIQGVLGEGESDDPLVQGYTLSTLDSWEQARKVGGYQGLSYGVGSLDRYTGGMLNGEVTVVGARSGVGKSSLMCQAAVSNCLEGIPVHMFSLEMSRQQVLHRIWAIVSRVPFLKIRNPQMATPEEINRIRSAALSVAEWPLRIHDKAELHIAKIVALARLSIRKHGTRLVAVDYAQNVEADGKDERTKVSSVSRQLTRMIKHEKASLLLLSQLRKVDHESYSRPPHEIGRA